MDNLKSKTVTIRLEGLTHDVLQASKLIRTALVVLEESHDIPFRRAGLVRHYLIVSANQVKQGD